MRDGPLFTLPGSDIEVHIFPLSTCGFTRCQYLLRAEKKLVEVMYVVPLMRGIGCKLLNKYDKYCYF
jgi:hypothetical protein